MATHYDLEEQEQIAQLKHFWARYGNAITWVLIAVMGAYAAWNGWQFWQRRVALEATALYDALEQAAGANEVDKVTRVWADIQQAAASTAQAQQAGLLVARVLQQAGQGDAARQALEFVLKQSKDEGLQAVARLRLAAVEIEAGQPDAALRWLDTRWTGEFLALAEDRRGDAWQGQGKHDEARQAYQKAWEALDATVAYRRIVEAKLNALGVNPGQTTPKEAQQ